MATLPSGVMRTAIALAFCAAPAGASPPTPFADGPFAECHQGHSDPGNTMAVCRNWVANTTRMPAADEAWDAMVTTHMVGYARGSGGVVGEERQPVVLAGRNFVMTTVTAGGETAPTLQGIIAWPAEPQPTIEIHSCLVSTLDPDGPARCPEVLEALVSTGIPEGLPILDPEAPQFVKRPVPVGAQCISQAEPYRAMINCMPRGGGALDWMQLEVAAKPEELTMLRDATLRELQTMRPGEWTVEDTSCQMEGVPSTCWQYTQQDGEPPARQALLVYGEFRGIPLVAKCLYKGEASALPQPCDDVLSF
jgi:hypothetical protein